MFEHIQSAVVVVKSGGVYRTARLYVLVTTRELFIEWSKDRYLLMYDRKTTSRSDVEWVTIHNGPPWQSSPTGRMLYPE